MSLFVYCVAMNIVMDIPRWERAQLKAWQLTNLFAGRAHARFRDRIKKLKSFDSALRGE